MARVEEWERRLVGGVEVSTTGAGPGIVLVPGDNRRAHHYEQLARDLAGAHTVHVIERRGRGASAPRDPSYSVETEADDVLAVLDDTGARVVFGHSYGGLIAMHAALRHPLDALIAYEPGVSLGGSFDLGWLDAFRRKVDDGKYVSALATFLKGTDSLPLRVTPLLWAISFLLLFGREERDLLPLTPAELAEIARLDSDGSRYAAITSPTLLLGGSKSPAYLTGVLPRLAEILPHAEYAILPDLDHHAPDETAPDEIAQQIRLHLIRAERHRFEQRYRRSA
ncbi:alpha/beta hydrolase [Kribbella sp. NPDC048915]|uniref:alpha/beta fold hydrolase n=1 Tax=Kribbella sp. NPDC048915 TaxID=3155148 RepID=UPI00340012DA